MSFREELEKLNPYEMGIRKGNSWRINRRNGRINTFFKKVFFDVVAPVSAATSVAAAALIVGFVALPMIPLIGMGVIAGEIAGVAPFAFTAISGGVSALMAVSSAFYLAGMSEGSHKRDDRPPETPFTLVNPTNPNLNPAPTTASTFIPINPTPVNNSAPANLTPPSSTTPVTSTTLTSTFTSPPLSTNVSDTGEALPKISRFVKKEGALPQGGNISNKGPKMLS